MSKSKGIPVELLERANQSLFALPVKPAKGQAEAAEFLTPGIKFAMKRGYSLNEIQEHIAKEFGLTLQMTKMKKALAPQNAQTDGVVAKPKKEKKQKQTDTPPATTDSESTTNDEGATSNNGTEGRPEKQTAATVAADIMPTGGSEIAEDKAENADGDNTDGQTDTTTTAQETDTANDEKGEGEKVIYFERVDLNCPKYQKDEAKDLGAKWDQAKYVWYVPAGLDLTLFEKWLTHPLDEYRRKAELRSLVAHGSFEVTPDTPEGEL